MTNGEAKGYVILAMHEAGCKYSLIRKVLQYLECLCDTVTEADAQERGFDQLGKLRNEEDNYGGK